ncbi:ribulokinase [Alkalispirochaeta americana]|uniref:Ribulokinase n=1 Tax=Alkalispirochaeta americana TaxID=159291 RepID=A0A1N6UTM8_9SPIO|nr:FGGY family carbohydrate kinase [Alkalispirochaeta americana]SIQ68576.1 ribulokinase [Alkalispirochaeta americana]
MSGKYVLGVDFGTESVRVGIIDEQGGAAAIAVRTYPLHHPGPGRAEQNPDDWWTALVEACNEAVSKSLVSPEDIAGISLDATASTVVVLDKNGRHLRPAIMWMDVRATEEAKRIEHTGDPALKYNGFGPVSAEFGLPKALWIKKHEPQIYAKSAHIVDCCDWAIYRLTGQWSSSVNVASAKYYYDRDSGGWPTSLYNALDAVDLLEKLIPHVRDIFAVAGELRRDVAEELGLAPGTPVAQGGVDAYMGALGLGVVEPGTIALVTGSSHVVIGQSAKPIHGPGLWGAYTDAMLPGTYTLEAGQASTGSILSWFKNSFCGEYIAEAERRGVNVYEVLNEAAENIPIGSEGLVVLDYFQGNRAPHSDPYARGAIWGLSLSHTPAHLYRAIMEGVCYGTANMFDALRTQGYDPSTVMVAGGPTKSPLWMQMHADVLGQPLHITKGGDIAPLLGSAMLAAVGSGVHADLPTAASAMVHTELTVEPDMQAHEAYRFYFDRYRETYDQLKSPMHSMATHLRDSAEESCVRRER